MSGFALFAAGPGNTTIRASSTMVDIWRTGIVEGCGEDNIMAITAQQREELFKLARQAGDRWRASWTAMSGADMAEGEVFRYVRDVYVAAAQDEDIATAITRADSAWRVYATQNNAKIAAAPKLKRGPSAGQSAISYRYTSPDLFESKLIHIRHMIGLLCQ